MGVVGAGIVAYDPRGLTHGSPIRYGGLLDMTRESDSARCISTRRAAVCRSQIRASAEVAQLVEHTTENRGVASSILALGTNVCCARAARNAGEGT